MKYWEIIADDLSKAGWELGLSLSDSSLKTTRRLAPQAASKTRLGSMEPCHSASRGA